MLIPDKPDRSGNVFREEIKSSKNETQLDLEAMEKNLQYQLDQCSELKNKLLKVLGSFDK